MKMFKYSFIIGLVVFLTACQEEGPFINFEEDQETLVDTVFHLVIDSFRLRCIVIS